MNKEKIAVLTDTGSVLTKQEAKELGIYLLPLQIIETIGNEINTYLDLVDVSTQDIYQKIYDDIDLKTSLPALSTIYETIEQIKKDGYNHIICVPLTPGISSTASNIYVIANELDIPIDIIDTFTTCQIQNHIVKEVKHLIDLNYSSQQIIDLVNKQISESYSLILASDINHLKKGGRITPAAASLASMLKIVPILKMGHDTLGRIDVFDKVRTKRKANIVLVQEILKHVKHKNYEFYIIHSDDYKEALSLKELLMNNDIEEEHIHINYISSVISVHVGMKCLAIQVIENIKEE